MSTTGRHLQKAFGAVLISVLVASASQAATVGQNRCGDLQRQLLVLTQTSRDAAPHSVGELAGKAHALCSVGKTAQGLRAYAKALAIMGSQPVFPSEQQTATR